MDLDTATRGIWLWVEIQKGNLEDVESKKVRLDCPANPEYFDHFLSEWLSFLRHNRYEQI